MENKISEQVISTYIRDGGGFCPICGSHDIDISEILNNNEHYEILNQSLSCNNCQSFWRERYEMTNLILDVNGVEEEKRAADAAKKGMQEFWLTVAKLYPEIKTGDLDPLADIEFLEKAKDLIKTWASWNRRNNY